MKLKVDNLIWRSVKAESIEKTIQSGCDIFSSDIMADKKSYSRLAAALCFIKNCILDIFLLQ